MSDRTPVREVATDHGRVYQPAGHLRTYIDWTPPAPLAGHRTLTRGTPKDHPTEGRIVQFAETAGAGRAKKIVCVRITPDRGTLAELVAIAGRLDGEIEAGWRAEAAAKKAEIGARIAADVAAFEATLPAGYIRIEDVEHNPAAADGWGSTRYRHGGVELSYSDVAGMDARWHRVLGDPYHVAVYAPADRLSVAVDRSRAEAAAKEGAAAAKAAAKAADRLARFARAKETGSPVELDRWTEECDDFQAECDLDIVVRYAQPDGTVATRRIHTH